ncbi:MAG TPA: CBS domain-containing protein [Bacilli bacterium]|nr:CBS domain-containing protein [Bacilli bacterium]
MSADLTVLKPNDTIREAASLMEKEDIGAIPICEKDNDLIGIVTDRDLVIRGYAKGMTPNDLVEHCMTEDIVTCREDTLVSEVGELMSEHQIRRIPVVKDNRLIGMVSLGDLVTEEKSDHLAIEALADISEHEHFH